MPQAIWTSLAEADLENIVYYIAVEEERPLVASQIAREIRDHCERLVGNRLLGEARPDLGR